MPNWLHVGGDDGLKTTSVLLSACASATRHRLNPWSYLRDVLDNLAVRPAGADLSDLLPDALTQAPANGRIPRAA
jgi:transposase